jgi:hypothetical protein
MTNHIVIAIKKATHHKTLLMARRAFDRFVWLKLTFLYVGLLISAMCVAWVARVVAEGIGLK